MSRLAIVRRRFAQALVLAAGCLFTAVPAARAQVTTYNSPTNISSIASGNTAVLVNGGSLTNGFLNNSGTLQFDLSNNLTITTVFSGTGAFVKTNSGTVEFNAQNGFTGPISIAAGTLRMGPQAFDQGLGNAQQIFFTGTDGSLDIGENNTVNPGITLTGTGVFQNTGNSSMSLNGRITGTGGIVVLSSGSALASPTSIGFQNLIRFSPTTPSDYVGTTTIRQGWAGIDSLSMPNTAFGSTSNTIVMDGGGLAYAQSSGSATILNPITLGAGGGRFAAQAAGANAGRLYLASVSGTGSLTSFGGSVYLTGSNSFTGDTYLGTTGRGALNLEHVDALANSTINRIVSDTASRLQVSGPLASGTAFVNIGGIKGVASLLLASGSNFSFGGNNQSTTYSGTLGWGAVEQQGYYETFRKAGTGTLTLTSDNRAASGVVLANGVLAVNSDRALGVGTGIADSANPTPAVNTRPVVMTGGTLQLTTLFTMPRAITLQTGGGGLDTTLISNASTPTFPGNVTGTANLAIWANGETNGTSTGATLLTGTNTYVGTTTIFTGVVTATSNFGSASNTVALNGGGLLATGGTRTNNYAVSLGAANGWLRAAASGDTLNQAAAISGTGNLLKSGSGVVNLQTANTNSGDVRIFDGTLNAANVNALQNATLDMNAADAGTLGLTVAGNTTYNIGGLKGSRNIDNTGDTLSVGANNQSTTYSGNLSGAGGFTKVGSGALTLDGVNSYSGGSTVSAGSVIGDADSLQGAITNNAAVEFAQATSGTYAGSMGGTGSFTKTGGGTLTMSGTNSYGGGSTVSAGRLVGTTSSIQGSITNNAEVEFAQATAGTYSGAMTGSGSLTKSGAGAVTLTGASSYGGATDVSAGTLVVNADNSGATGALSVASGATLAGSGTHGGAVALNAGSTVSPGNSPGTFTAASGTWAGGANYNWQLTNAAGSAGTDWDLFSFTGGLDITATSGSPFAVNLWTLSGTGPDVNGNASNFNSNSSYSWRIATAAGGVTGFAANKFTVNTSSTNGTGGFANSFGSGQFSVANTGNDVNVVFSPAVVFNVTSGTQTQTQQGADANMSTAVSVTKTGAGTVVMNGNNTYSAATTVSAGTMLVTGTLANSAVTVAAGATLGGDGLVGALATIANSGTLSPGGTDFGRFQLGGLSLGSSATTVMAITGTSPGVNLDQVSILTGPLAFGGTLDLASSNIDGAAVGTSYKLFDFAVTPSGNFSSLTALGGSYSGITWTGPVSGVWTSTVGTGGSALTFTEGTGTLAVVVPEPAAIALVGMGLAGLAVAVRRRRAA
jgi:fibronectin-binding autotransporter adhesin